MTLWIPGSAFGRPRNDKAYITTVSRFAARVTPV